MALVVCPDCNRHVSDAAPACAGCGRPLAPSIARTKSAKSTLNAGITIAVGGIVVLAAIRTVGAVVGVGPDAWMLGAGVVAIGVLVAIVGWLSSLRRS